jgi:hypothetical protein
VTISLSQLNLNAIASKNDNELVQVPTYVYITLPYPDINLKIILRSPFKSSNELYIAKSLYTSFQFSYRALLNCTTLAVNLTQILRFTVILYNRAIINCSVTESELSSI